MQPVCGPRYVLPAPRRGAGPTGLLRADVARRGRVRGAGTEAARRVPAGGPAWRSRSCRPTGKESSTARRGSATTTTTPSRSSCSTKRSAGDPHCGIGDGGSEVGFGKVAEATADISRPGEVCHCPCGGGNIARRDDHLVVAQSRTGALRRRRDDRLTYGDAGGEALDEDDLERMLRACVDTGAYDGAYARPLLSDDGVPLRRTAPSRPCCATSSRSGSPSSPPPATEGPAMEHRSLGTERLRGLPRRSSAAGRLRRHSAPLPEF